MYFKVLIFKLLSFLFDESNNFQIFKKAFPVKYITSSFIILIKKIKFFSIELFIKIYLKLLQNELNLLQ